MTKEMYKTYSTTGWNIQLYPSLYWRIQRLNETGGESTAFGSFVQYAMLCSQFWCREKVEFCRIYL